MHSSRLKIKRTRPMQGIATAALRAVAPRKNAPGRRVAGYRGDGRRNVCGRLLLQGGSRRRAARSTRPGRLEDLFQIVQIAFQIFLLRVTAVGLANPEEEGRGRCWLAERHGRVERGRLNRERRRSARGWPVEGGWCRGCWGLRHREHARSRRCRSDVKTAERSRFVGGGKQALSVDQPPPDFGHVSRPRRITQINQALQRLGQLGDADLSGFQGFVGLLKQVGGRFWVGNPRLPRAADAKSIEKSVHASPSHP